jgi:Fur family ferric uptake transcriptional regulator
MEHEVERRRFARYLAEHGRKQTRQRQAILDVFLSTGGHLGCEQLLQAVRELHPNIGYTTVYRTLKLLCRAGLARERRFDDGITRYETDQEHHDHLVCVKCGRIIEFECEAIEASQNEIAERHGFRMLRHRHELYGHCAECRSQAPASLR